MNESNEADSPSQGSTHDSDLTSRAKKLSNLPSWYVAYIALAVLNLFAVSLSLWLNYREVQWLDASVNEYRSTQAAMDSRRIQLAAPGILAEQARRVREVRTVSFWLVVGSIVITIAVLIHARRVKRTTRFQKIQRERLIQALGLARDQAEHAARVKSQFLANMSHEIRTPMNGVLGMLDALAVTPLSPDQAKLLRTADASADLLLSIIDDVLDFSKIEAGMMVIESVIVDLPEIVQHVHSLYGARAAEKLLTLRYEMPELTLPRVRSDATRLTQLLSNLVGNAIKFTATGEVVIKLELQEAPEGATRIKFSVRDSGIGIDPEAQARLFAPFTQADSSTSRRFGGTGLGLAICKQLVTLLDHESGEIGVHSIPGAGATFYFTLTMPRITESETQADSVGMSNKERDSELRFAGSVLVAEDNQTNQYVASTMLQNMGLRATIAANGREAVEAVQRQHFDLILMDYHMPELDGCGAATGIRRFEQASNAPRTPIVAITASVLKEDKQRCIAAGMDDFLAKPIRQRTLGAILLKWLPANARCDIGVAQQSALKEMSSPALSHLPSDLFDVQQFGELRAMGGDNFAEILEQFHLNMLEGLDSLRAAIASQDAAGVKRIAHKLKGATATVGATTLAQRFAVLEVNAQAAKLEDAPEHFNCLEKEYLEVQRYMQAEAGHSRAA